MRISFLTVDSMFNFETQQIDIETQRPFKVTTNQGNMMNVFKLHNRLVRYGCEHAVYVGKRAINDLVSHVPIDVHL